MSQSVSKPSVSLRGPPYLGTRSHNPIEDEVMDNMMASINVITDQIRAIQTTDKLPSFREATCDPHTWIARFESLAASRHWRDNRHEMLPTYLEENEHVWFQDLPPDTKNDYQSLKAAFLSEFAPSNADCFDTETTLRSTKQPSGESVKTYIRNVQKEARRIGLEERRAVDIILKNMLPAARVTITTTPKTYGELLDTPVSKGEICINTTADDKYQQLLDLLVKKETQIAALQAEHHNQKPVDRDRGYRNDRRRGPGDHQPPNTRHQQRGPMHGHQSGGPRHGHQSGGPRHGRCTRCGGTCLNQYDCRAWGKLCHNCNNLNHFAEFCFSRAKGNNRANYSYSK